MPMDYTCIDIVMTSEKIDLLKCGKEDGSLGVVAKNHTGSLTEKIHKIKPD